MSAIQNKIKSRRGASITFALLLFLVCAVISSVVIVAATASAGRVSGVRETDQRYYAAIETAKTLKKIFDGKMVDVTYAPETPAVATPPTGSDYALLKQASISVATGGAYESTEINLAEKDGYTCAVTPTLEGGLLTFDINAKGGTQNINTGTYNLKIVFASNVKRSDLVGADGTTKATVTWKMHSLRKGRAQSPSTGG